MGPRPRPFIGSLQGRVIDVRAAVDRVVDRYVVDTARAILPLDDQEVGAAARPGYPDPQRTGEGDFVLDLGGRGDAAHPVVEVTHHGECLVEKAVDVAGAGRAGAAAVGSCQFAIGHAALRPAAPRLVEQADAGSCRCPAPVRLLLGLHEEVDFVEPPDRISVVIGSYDKDVEYVGITAQRIDRGLRRDDASCDLEPGAPAGAGVPPDAEDAVVFAYGEDIEVIGIARHDADGRVGGRCAVGKHKPACCPAAIGIPPDAVDSMVRADDEEVQVGRITRDGRNRTVRGGEPARNLKPVCPAGAGIPPGAEDAMIRPDCKKVDMVGVAGHRRDRRSGCGDAAADNEPVRSPAAVGIPPDTVDFHIRPDHKQVQMIGVPGNGRDGSSGRRGQVGNTEPAVGPPAVRIPPDAVDLVVRSHYEKIEVVGIAGDHRDCRPRRRDAAGNLEPVRPSRGDIPPRAVNSVVGTHAKDIEMLRIPRNRGNGSRRCRNTAADANPIRCPTHCLLLPLIFMSQKSRTHVSGKIVLFSI
jgi:hypothetical protein